MITGITQKQPVIAWWSGGADSAVTCWLCIKWYGIDCVRVVFIDTWNEDEDTYRFKKDCELWYGCQIETISSKKWDSIDDVWEHYLALNHAHGAICSTELKRVVRQDFQQRNEFSYQAFGFDIQEINRAKNLRKNYPNSNPIFPLIYELMGKGDSIKILEKKGIKIPIPYVMGYHNNNCFQTGCVKGGVGYWQKIQQDFPEKFDSMAAREHDFTNKKGEPVTICKDQSNNAKRSNNGRAPLVFLKPHPDYPYIKDISMINGRQPESLMECNGFCGPKQVEIDFIKTRI